MIAAEPAPATQDTRRLVDLIREQSASEVAQLLADAQARVTRIGDAASADVKAIHAATVRDGEQRGQRRAAALLAVAEAQSRLTLLREREACIDKALALARQRLANLSTLPNAAAMVRGFIREALSALEPGPVRVQIPAEQAALLDAATRRQLGAGRWALRFETAPVPGGGVIVETEDGRRRFDNSINVRVGRRAQQLRQLAAQLLWPTTQSEPSR
jgi:vacuolar-type H+-ATPase subunit E/Vma4